VDGDPLTGGGGPGGAGRDGPSPRERLEQALALVRDLALEGDVKRCSGALAYAVDVAETFPDPGRHRARLRRVGIALCGRFESEPEQENARAQATCRASSPGSRRPPGATT
jgi:hypothetical protein